MLLFSAKKEIRGIYLQSKLYFPMVEKLNQAIGVAYDGHYIYWTDILAGHESIVRSLEDGSERDVKIKNKLLSNTFENVVLDSRNVWHRIS